VTKRFCRVKNRITVGRVQSIMMRGQKKGCGSLYTGALISTLSFTATKALGKFWMFF
jgi:hypothetical protein